MQELPRNWLTEAQFAAISELNHVANGLAAVFPIETTVMGETH